GRIEAGKGEVRQVDALPRRAQREVERQPAQYVAPAARARDQDAAGPAEFREDGELQQFHGTTSGLFTLGIGTVSGGRFRRAVTLCPPGYGCRVISGPKGAHLWRRGVSGPGIALVPESGGHIGSALRVLAIALLSPPRPELPLQAAQV